MRDTTLQKLIGSKCKEFREKNLKVTQKDIADEIGYSKESVSAFETGRNNNCYIFLYYVSKGLLFEYSLEELIGWWNND